MSHEIVPNGEAEGGPENDASLPDAVLAPLHWNPCVGDDMIEDEDGIDYGFADYLGITFYEDPGA